jgi:hypothetical protein
MAVVLLCSMVPSSSTVVVLVSLAMLSTIMLVVLVDSEVLVLVTALAEELVVLPTAGDAGGPAQGRHNSWIATMHSKKPGRVSEGDLVRHC